jgi:hypothetical protein
VRQGHAYAYSDVDGNSYFFPYADGETYPNAEATADPALAPNAGASPVGLRVSTDKVLCGQVAGIIDAST